MAQIQELKVPYRDSVADGRGLLSRAWQEFYKYLKIIIDPLGVEKSYTLLNNQAAPVKIPGLRFTNRQLVSFCDYVIQRITDASESIETGTFKVVYLPDAVDFVLEPDPNAGPDSAGITLSVNSDGEAFYASTNVAETHEIFKISLRQRYLTGGNLL